MLDCKRQRGARKSKGLHHSKVKYPFIGSSTIHQGFFFVPCVRILQRAHHLSSRLTFFPSVQVSMELEKLLRIHQL